MPFKDFDLAVLTPADINTYIMEQVIIRCTSATRPASPSEGWHIYETDTQRFLVFRSSAWVIEGELELVALKNVSEAYTSNVLHNDASLFLPMSANTTYILESFLAVTNSVAGFNFSFSWDIPAGASMRYASSHAVSAVTKSIYTDCMTENRRFFINTDSVNVQVNTQGTVTRPRGIIIVGSTPGNLQFKWRGGTGTATLKALSHIRLQAMI